MSKRNRWNDQELLEPFAALLRQSTSRVVERLRLIWTRNNTFNINNTMPMALTEERTHFASNLSTNKSTQLLPFDRLVIEYTLYYLDHTQIPHDHYIRMAQDVLAGSVERIRFAPLFNKSLSLPLLCEALVEENSASAIESAMTEIEAWTDLRATLGEWIANRRELQSSADRRIKDDYGDDDDDYEDDDDYYTREEEELEEEEEEEEYNKSKDNMRNANRLDELENDKTNTDSDALLDLVAVIYKSLEFWVRVQSFINALSEGFAKMNVVELEPRYERELMLLLHRLSRNKEDAQSTDKNKKTQYITNSTVSISPTLESKEDNVKKYDNESKEFYNSKTTKMKTESTKVKVEENENEEHQFELEYEEQHKKEEEEEEEMQEKRSEIIHTGVSSEDVDSKQQLANVVLGDTLALSHCYVPAMDYSRLLGSSTPSITTFNTIPSKATLLINIPDKLKQELRGINYNYYTMVHARLGMMITREQLRLFGLHHTCNPPKLNSQQNELLASAQMQAMQHGNMFAMFGNHNMNVNGLPVDYIPDENYYSRLLASQQDAINEDENIYSDEVIDYYLRKKNAMNTSINNNNNNVQNSTFNTGQVFNKDQQQQQNQQRGAGMRAGNATAYPNNTNTNNNKLVTTELIKPHRFCKVKTGYTWNQYNRTHYDSRTNPPPRTVLWYEFTLFYPALVNTKKDMRHIFHIEDTPRGAEDDYCLLVFSVGPPYADVAYRIVKKQWDTRKGGVRISFDATGRYKLFFRFTNSNYRR